MTTFADEVAGRTFSTYIIAAFNIFDIPLITVFLLICPEVNKIEFTYRPYYLALASTLFFVVFYQAIVATINGNPFGYLPACVALSLIFLMAMKHEYTKTVLYIWASVFMILAYSIKIASKFITQSGNMESGFQVSSIYMNAVFVLLGILAIWGGRLFISEVDTDT